MPFSHAEHSYLKGGSENNLNILKTAKTFRRLQRNGDQKDRKTETRFEIIIKFWIYLKRCPVQMMNPEHDLIDLLIG